MSPANHPTKAQRRKIARRIRRGKILKVTSLSEVGKGTSKAASLVGAVEVEMRTGRCAGCRKPINPLEPYFPAMVFGKLRGMCERCYRVWVHVDSTRRKEGDRK